MGSKRMLNIALIISTLIFFVLGGVALAQDNNAYVANEKSLARHYAVPDWFRDAKLGIYFTWIEELATSSTAPELALLYGNISSLSLNNSLEHGAIAEVKSLNGDNIDYWKQDIDGLWIKLKANAPSQLAYAFSIK